MSGDLAQIPVRHSGGEMEAFGDTWNLVKAGYGGENREIYCVVIVEGN